MNNSGSLPVIADASQLIPYLNIWRSALNGLLRTARPPAIPINFTATPGRGTITLSWAAVNGADGYELLKSTSADMTSAVTIPIRSSGATSYTDAIALSGATLPTSYYQIHATAGTVLKPYSVKGADSGVISSAPLDPTDVATTPTPTYDTTVVDQSGASLGNYRSFSGGGRFV